jgi:hypothetical protein
MNFWIGMVAVAVGVLMGIGLIVGHVSNEVRRAAGAGRRKVVRLRAKLLRWPLTPGLTPLALVYRVTLEPPEPEAKTVTKLFAYDPGQIVLRGSSVRQFSGGVWRDA